MMKLTVFTPTFNRAGKLKNVYASLSAARKRLTAGQEIEWLIVDDGSVDDTQNTVADLVAENAFEIRYYKKENGGKHTAFNLAIEECRGDLFLCLDDDDRLIENSLRDIFDLAEQYRGKGYGGIVGRVTDPDGNLLGKTVFENTLVSNTIEIRDKYKFWGEPEIYYTEILKLYRFPVFPGEKFLTEAMLFDEMSIQHPFVYSNITMMVKEYLPGGLSDNGLKIRIESPNGAEAYYFKRRQLCKGLWHKFRATINRQRFSYWIKQNRPRRKMSGYEFFAKPISFVFYLKDRSKQTQK